MTQNEGAMKSLRCTLEFDEETMHPVHRRLTNDEALVREYLLHANRSRDGADTLLFYVEGDRDVFASILDDTDRIRKYDITTAGEDAHFAYIRDSPSEFDMELESTFDVPGLLVVPPIEFWSDGTARLTVVGEPEALNSVIDDIPAEVRLDIDHIGEYDSASVVPGVDLTSRQLEAVEIAHQLGYYEVPRRGTVEEVAERLGCTPATASEHLRKAEQKVMGSLVDRTPG